MCTPTQKKLCGKENCKICFDRSFASNEKSKYWYECNNLNPIDVLKNSNKKYKFKCGECNHIFEAIPNSINRGRWCPYCVNKKLCEDENCKTCFKKSFASHKMAKHWHKSNKLNTRDVFKGTPQKYKFKCGECKHLFEAGLNCINKGRWCPYCTNQKLCDDENCKPCFEKSFASHIKSKNWHKSNKLNTRDVFKNTSKKYKFKCEECKYLFEKSLFSINLLGQWCPNCVNKTHKKLKEWLNDKTEFESISEKTFNWCKNDETGKHYRFDEYLKEIKCIIELDGDQHFKQVSNWASNEDTRQADVYKMKCALEHNISIIRIYQMDVLNDKNKWRKKLRKAIKTVQESESPIVIYISSGDHYGGHQEDMGSDI